LQIFATIRYCVSGEKEHRGKPTSVALSGIISRGSILLYPFYSPQFHKPTADVTIYPQTLFPQKFMPKKQEQR
jgi:hypothetical protein